MIFSKFTMSIFPYINFFIKKNTNIHPFFFYGIFCFLNSFLLKYLFILDKNQNIDGLSIEEYSSLLLSSSGEFSPFNFEDDGNKEFLMKEIN